MIKFNLMTVSGEIVSSNISEFPAEIQRRESAEFGKNSFMGRAEVTNKFVVIKFKGEIQAYYMPYAPNHCSIVGYLNEKLVKDLLNDDFPEILGGGWLNPKASTIGGESVDYRKFPDLEYEGVLVKR